MPTPEYVRPATLVAALGLMHRDRARLVAGGTDVILRVSPEVETLIDLADLGLDTISDMDDGIYVGAMATLSAMLEHEPLATMLDGYVAGMLRQVGSPLLRNLATIGGHIARGRISDIIPVLLTLDARVGVYDGADHSLELDEYLTAGAGSAGTIVTHVMIPNPPAGTAAEFLKFGRTAFDLALLNCACLVTVQESTVTTARIAIGETPHLGSRLTPVEDALIGTDLGPDAIEEAAEVARVTVQTGDDLRATAGYRRQLAFVAVKRCLRAAGTRLGTVTA